jgi:hypothetical protein
MDDDAVFWLDNITVLSGNVFSVIGTGARSQVFLTGTTIDTKDLCRSLRVLHG